MEANKNIELNNMLNLMCSKVGWNVGYYIESDDGRVIAARNENKAFSSASVIKLNILWSIYLDINTGKLDKHNKLIVGKDEFIGGSGVLKCLEPGHEYTIRELCVLMIDFSDNIATNMLIDLLGLDKINQDISDCGLEGTKLQRRMMNMEARLQGLDNVTTPMDAASILKMVHNSDILSRELRDDMLQILRDQENSRYLPHYMPEEVDFAHKPGGLSDVLNDAGILFLPDGYYYIAVMTGGFSNRAEGMRFINELGSVVYERL